MSRSATVYLLTDDYAERLEELYRDAVVLEQQAEKANASRRLNEMPAYKAKRDEYEALKAEAEAAAIKVTLRAVGRREWRALKDKHPPRSEHPDPDVVKADRMAGVNVETVEDDLVHASLVEPEFSSRAAFDEWADSLSEAEFQTILGRAWTLANTVRTDPKSLPALPTPSGD